MAGSRAATAAPASVDAYVAAAPADVQPLLHAIRAVVSQAAPQAEERISYRMPAFFQDGALVYFAAFKAHIGFFPPVADPRLKARLARYAGPKGNLRFPLAEPLPLDLIADIVEARLQENRQRRAGSRPA